VVVRVDRRDGIELFLDPQVRGGAARNGSAIRIASRPVDRFWIFDFRFWIEGMTWLPDAKRVFGAVCSRMKFGNEGNEGISECRDRNRVGSNCPGRWERPG
jgi:hypothetical protein